MSEMQKKDLDLFVGYPRFEEIISLMRECHDTFGDPRPTCGLFIAEPGIGKTTLIEEYIYRYGSPRKLDGLRTIVPILHMGAPGSASPKSFVSRALKRLGDPAWSKGTKDQMAERLIDFIVDCQVTLMIVEEVQHLVDSDSNDVITKTRDTIKDLLDSTKTPIILFGRPDAASVVDGDQQVKDRFSVRKQLEPFQYRTDKQRKEFERFLRGIDEQLLKQLPFSRLSGLDSEEMARRLFYASDGNLRHLVEKLIKNAALYAVKNGQDCLDLKVLARAFERHLHGIMKQKINPFDPKFDPFNPPPQSPGPVTPKPGGMNEKKYPGPYQEKQSDCF